MKRIEDLGRVALLPQALAAALAIGAIGAAGAAEFDLGNPDLKLRWDNTVRYNLGARMERQDRRILNFSTADEGDAKFDKHDIVTNRLDLFSELDVSYKKMFGARFSGAAWYDHAYEDAKVRTVAPGVSSYYNDTYNSTVKRYVNGPSGEVLDAFVWGNFNLGAVPVNVKLGRHSVVWGEGLLLGAHAVSFSQAPVDGVKAVNSPGIETKEVFLPLGQLSFKAQVTDSVSVFGQYFYEWKPTRVPHGGTYLMGADTTPTVDRLVNGFDRIAPHRPKDAGNWGVGARYNLEAIESTLGAYYREFDDYTPETGTQLFLADRKFRFVYARDVKLLGLSFARQIGPVSVGSDLSLRKNAHLNSNPSMIGFDTGARGDTLHFVVNGTYGLPKTPLWDTGVFLGEFAYNRLQKVTSGANLYRGIGYAGCTEVSATQNLQPNACSTREFYQLAMNLVPQYIGVMPSWDLSLPMSVNIGLKGKSPNGGGGFEDVKSWSIGATATYASKYEFSLRYSDLIVPTRYSPTATATVPAGGAVVGGGALNSAVGATDRGWLVFTFKTSF